MYASHPAQNYATRCKPKKTSYQNNLVTKCKSKDFSVIALSIRSANCQASQPVSLPARQPIVQWPKRRGCAKKAKRTAQTDAGSRQQAAANQDLLWVRNKRRESTQSDTVNSLWQLAGGRQLVATANNNTAKRRVSISRARKPMTNGADVSCDSKTARVMKTEMNL